MHKFLALLLLCLLATTTSAADRTQVFAASTSGELKIDAEGRVVDLRMKHRQLGDDVMAAVEQRIRDWRFEPVQVDGQPVAVTAWVFLDMLALREPGGDGLTLAFRHVRFQEPQPEEAIRAVLERRKMGSTTYPASLARLGVGGTVWLSLRVDAEGRVADVASLAVELRTERADSPAAQRAQARELTRASERGARNWVLPDSAGTTVMVPIHFTMDSNRGERWARVHNVPIEPPAWVIAEQAATVRLSESGERSSERIRLLSVLN